MKNVLCVALGAVAGSVATALVGAKVILKSIEEKKELCDKYVPEKSVAEMLSNISDPEELKEYVLRLRQALMTDDETDMEKLLADLAKFEPKKHTETDDEEDDFIIDPKIQAMLDEMDNKLSEVFNGFNQQYEDISDKLDIINSMLTGEYDDEDEESDEESSDDEWKEIEVETTDETSQESSEEVVQTPDPEPEKEATYESVITKMDDKVINPLCSKYGEELRQPLEVAVCRLLDHNDDNVFEAYLKKFTSALRSSRGSKKQIQKYIAEIEKLPVSESDPETSAE